ncbi:antibiotic biosynthesis monooxygenase family protein [Jonesia quinghaiensis]|uniref:antibiotic biosynthesis monooxygenase family protein n=1 Tax=Jonesia quinghaiensis TaxID=262806 RepID=UPI00040E99DA|nr:antibiotic biosynthesis monooxygenase [Jonesia quinghaiensis]
MSVIKINAISVPEGAGAELEKRFAARKHMVDSEPGFEGFQLLRPVAGESRYFVVTQWASQEDFERWRDGRAKEAHANGGARDGEGHGHGHGQGHGQGEGAEQPHQPVATGADLLEFEVVEF